MTLSDIASFQPKAWRVLGRSFANDRLAGTYLFTGRDGTGKWLLANALAALVNCEHPAASDDLDSIPVPCGECRSCRLIASYNFEGLYYALPIEKHKNLDEAIDLTHKTLELKRDNAFASIASSAHTSIPIAVARDIKKQLSRKATSGIRRVVMFYQMEKMLTQSADALLKLIEEPPEDAIIILTAERPERLLPTIRSRAQLIRTDRVPIPSMIAYLSSEMDLDPATADLLARIADGSLGQAISMAVRSDEDELSNREVHFQLFKSLILNDTPETVGLLHQTVDIRDRAEVAELLALWQSLIRDCTNAALLRDEAELTNLDFAQDIRKLSSAFDESSLAVAMTQHIKNTLADLRRNVHIQGALVALILRLKGASATAA